MPDAIATVVDETVEVTIEGADLLAPLVAAASASAATSTTKAGEAAASAATAAGLVGAAMMTPQLIAAEYGARLGPRGGWIHDLTYWRTLLWQDAAGTATRVSAAGDPVNCIKDLLGKPDDDLIWTGSGDGGTFRIRQGVPCIEWATSKGWRRRGGTVTMPINTYLLAGIAFTTSSINSVYGFVKSDSSHYHLSHGTAGGARASIQGVSPTRAVKVASGFYGSLPLLAATIIDSLAVPGSVSVRQNGSPEVASYSPIATDWVAGDTVSGMSFGVNVSGQSGGNATFDSKTGTFFGGMTILDGEVDRDVAVAKFLSIITPEIRPSDDVYPCFGASDSDDWNTDGGAPGEEIYKRLAQKLADENTDSSVIYIKADYRGDGLTGWREYSQGATDHRIFVINYSVSGAQGNFWQGDKFQRFVLDRMPHVTRFVWNQGGNSAVSPTTDPLGYMRVGELAEGMDRLRRAYPGVPHLVMEPYPFRSSDHTMDPIRLAWHHLADLFGDFEPLPTYATFVAEASNPANLSTLPSNLYAGDNAHLSQPLGVDLHFSVLSDGWDDYTPPARVAPALIGFTTSNGLSNGKMDEWSGLLPVDWTAGGGGIVERSMEQVDEEFGDLESLLLQREAGDSNSAYIQQVVNAVPYRGAPVMLALRQFLVAGGHSSTGRIQLFSNGTGAVTNTSWIYDANAKPSGIFRTAYHALPPIPNDATQITVRVWAAANGAAGKAFVGRAVLVGGLRPRLVR